MAFLEKLETEVNLSTLGFNENVRKTCDICSQTSPSNPERYHVLPIPFGSKSVGNFLLEFQHDVTNGRYDCGKCEIKQPSTRDICRSYNDILIVRVQRFQIAHTMSTTITKKICDEVEADRQVTIEGNRYNLKGFINHLGMRASEGHYVSYIEKDGKFYCFDDGERIQSREIKETEYKGASFNSYILFYEKDGCSEEVPLEDIFKDLKHTPSMPTKRPRLIEDSPACPVPVFQDAFTKSVQSPGEPQLRRRQL